MSIWRPPEFATHPAPFGSPTWRGYCHQVVDGDTYTVLVDLGFMAYSYIRVRLRGLDTPEIVGADALRGRAARERAEQLLLGKPVQLTVHRDERSLERWVADVMFWNGAGWHDLAEALRLEGHIA